MECMNNNVQTITQMWERGSDFWVGIDATSLSAMETSTPSAVRTPVYDTTVAHLANMRIIELQSYLKDWLAK